jgi:hypothetical protein
MATSIFTDSGQSEQNKVDRRRVPREEWGKAGKLRLYRAPNLLYFELVYQPPVGAWLSLVERLVRDQEAGGSNPLAPTKNSWTSFNHTG